MATELPRVGGSIQALEPNQLVAHKLGVNAPRDVRLVRSFDDRPSIRKERKLVVLFMIPDAGAQHELVGNDVAMFAHSRCDYVHVDAMGQLPVPELYGVASAQNGGARARLAVEVLETSMLATRTIAILTGAGNVELQ